MAGQSTQDGQKGAEQQAALEALEKERAGLQTRMSEIDERGRQLDEQEQAIAKEAASVEERVRKLAEEEAALLERKRVLQAEAADIGKRRTEVANRRKNLQSDKQRLQTEGQQIDTRKSQAEQQLAYEEALKGASITREPAGQADQRAHPRFAVAVDVSMHTEHNFYTGLTENLSEGGLFIATYDDLPLGTALDLKVSLPDRPPIEARGVVRWLREHSQFTEDVSPGVGVQFEGLSEADRNAIETFIRQRSPLFYETD